MRTTYLSDPGLGYGNMPPFDPAERFAEIEAHVTTRRGDNPVHGGLRRLLLAAGADSAGFGTASWNPLGNIICPGQSIVVKPNWVFDVRGREPLRNQLTTHGSFLRAVLDYIVIALRAQGRITVCDSPLQSASFDGILEDGAIPEIVAAYAHLPGLHVRYLDLRRFETSLDATMSRQAGIRALEGDPLGYTEIDLGFNSYLEELCARDPGIRLVVGDYSEDITNRNQRLGLHRYVIPNTILGSEVFVNVPKMKTHCKTGITGALKNLVGINDDKACLAHFRKRTHDTPGDEASGHWHLARAALFVDANLKRAVPEPVWKVMRAVWTRYKRRVYRRVDAGGPARIHLLTAGGSWYGNDTLWRTIYDLNTILFFADKDGRLRSEPQRGYITFVDGIVACEGEGPLHGTRRPAGTVILGDDPVSVDACMARLMGFDPAKIPLLCQAGRIRASHAFSCWNGENDAFDAGDSVPLKPFVPPLGWRHHIEGC